MSSIELLKEKAVRKGPDEIYTASVFSSILFGDSIIVDSSFYDKGS